MYLAINQLALVNIIAVSENSLNQILILCFHVQNVRLLKLLIELLIEGTVGSFGVLNSARLGAREVLRCLHLIGPFASYHGYHLSLMFCISRHGWTFEHDLLQCFEVHFVMQISEWNKLIVRS